MNGKDSIAWRITCCNLSPIRNYITTLGRTWAPSVSQSGQDHCQLLNEVLENSNSIIQIEPLHVRQFDEDTTVNWVKSPNG